jgi:hypothetical protein
MAIVGVYECQNKPLFGGDYRDANTRKHVYSANGACAIIEKRRQ